MRDITKQSGMSLLEVMLSLTLSILVLYGLCELLLTVKQQTQGIATRLQQLTDLTLVSQTIRDASQSAGYTPCRPLDTLTSYDFRTSKSLPSAITITPQRLCLRQQSFHTTRVVSFKSNSELGLGTDVTTLNFNRPLLITDCFHAEVVRVEKIQRLEDYVNLHLAVPLRYTYESPTYLGEWEESCFYIGKNGLQYSRDRADEWILGVVSLLAKKNKNDLTVTLTLSDSTELPIQTRLLHVA